jgi:hypothetical protein
MVAVYHKQAIKRQGPVMARALLATFETQRQAVAHALEVYRRIDHTLQRCDDAGLVMIERGVCVEWKDDSDDALAWAVIAEQVSDALKSEGRIDTIGEEDGRND